LTPPPRLAEACRHRRTPKFSGASIDTVIKTVGTSIKRLEDPRLLTGHGRFVDDVVRNDLAHAVIVRSAHAHAELRGVDLRRALAHPGVLGAVTAADFGDGLATIPLRSGARASLLPFLQLPIARGRVRYVGEPVAVLVATDRAAAEDARELVEVDYDPRPAVVDVDDAVSASAPRLFPDGNLAASWTTEVGDVESALRRAPHVVRERFSTGRLTGVPLETRGLLAEWADGRLTVWGATKVPYFNRRVLAPMLGVDESAIDFVETDAGGGFGSRGEFYPEDFLIPWTARRFGRPVKWVEERREHLMAINHSRQQEWTVAVGADADGTIRAFDAALVVDMGAYLRTHGVWVAVLTDAYLAGPYRLENYRCRVSCVLTTKTPTGTVRSPGFFEGTFVRERALDLVAGHLGLDPAAVRRRNLARPADAPYTIATVSEAVAGRAVSFEGEDFGAMFDHALEHAGYQALVADCRARNARAGDVRYGVGLAAAVETSGVGPPYETARVTLTAEGTVVLAAGATSIGQGPATTLAQVCADVLQVAPETIAVHLGDTRFVADGVGSHASRSAVMAGHAVLGAAGALRDRIRALAAERFEASPDDVVLEDGAAIVRGLPDRRCSLREIAALAGGSLAVEHRHEATRGIGACGVHIAVVSVDLATGRVRPERYVLVCDVGRPINPMIVDGQLVGGVVQGIGHALLESLVYDAHGQLLTGTLMDYALPRADAVPAIEVVLLDGAPGPNALGVKGAGETGTSGAGAALANAVAHALGDAAAIRRLPLTAPAVLEGARRGRA
jgi:CO/xanthine dehydrogenase Mo-binding subunit